MRSLSKALGANIRSKRELRRFSQDGFALLCGLDRSYMGRIERGEVNITVEKLYQIATVLNCNPAELLPDLNQLDGLKYSLHSPEIP